MATAKNTQNFVINSVAATAGDLSTGDGRVTVTGDTEGFLRREASSIVVNKFIAETLQVSTVTATAAPAAGTTYSYLLEQEVGGKVLSHYMEYYAPSGVTAAILGAAFEAGVQSLIDAGQLFATAAEITSGNGGVTITALTGYAVIRLKQANNVTFASSLDAETSSGNLSVSGLVLTMLEGDTTYLAVGQLHKLSGWTGTAVINGKTAAQGVILRAASVTTNTSVTYDILVITGSITAASCDYELLSSNATGIGADLTADRGITGGGDPNVDIVATNVYHEVVVSGGEPSGSTMTVGDVAPFEKHFFIDTVASASNALLLTDRFEEVQNYYAAGTTDADPSLL